MSLSQKLRHRITIQRATTTQDPDTGETTATWVDFLNSEPAEVVPLSGREFIQSGAVQAGVNTRMTIRWQAGVLPTMRVLFDGDIYRIEAVLPDPTARRHLTLMCERGVSSDGE